MHRLCAQEPGSTTSSASAMQRDSSHDSRPGRVDSRRPGRAGPAGSTVAKRLRNCFGASKQAGTGHSALGDRRSLILGNCSEPGHSRGRREVCQAVERLRRGPHGCCRVTPYRGGVAGQSRRRSRPRPDRGRGVDRRVRRPSQRRPRGPRRAPLDNRRPGPDVRARKAPTQGLSPQLNGVGGSCRYRRSRKSCRFRVLADA